MGSPPASVEAAKVLDVYNMAARNPAFLLPRRLALVEREAGKIAVCALRLLAPEPFYENWHTCRLDGLPAGNEEAGFLWKRPVKFGTRPS